MEAINLKPRYCLNTDTGRIDATMRYMRLGTKTQFLKFYKKKKYVLGLGKLGHMIQTTLFVFHVGGLG